MNFEFLADWLSVHYGLDQPVNCSLLRAYTNDVYLVHSGNQRFVLKLYGLGWRTESEIRYELDLIQHLAAQHVPIATPIAAITNDVLQTITEAEDTRYAVLFNYAAGDKPQPPFSIALYEAFGQAFAHMHAAADSLISPHARRALDLAHLIDEPLALIAPLITQPDDLVFLSQITALLKHRIPDFAANGLDWGPIHGDASLDNLHVTQDGAIVLYDFDSGGPGWRAADLQGWAEHNPTFTPKWQAFQQGYTRIRQIDPINWEAAPYLTIAWDLWGMKIELERRVLAQGLEQTNAFIATQLVQLRQRSSWLYPNE